jgi:very-short-patch-repair endonuclease/predicted transcriptional regulator of viral defense system
MGQKRLQWSAVWALARRQHGVVTRAQLLAMGMGPDEIQYRIETRRLHRVWRGVYAVGRPELTRDGIRMAAVLVCGPGAVLSHDSAGALLGIHPEDDADVHISVPARRCPRRPGITVHRRSVLAASDVVHVRGIPATSPIVTLIDLAARLPRGELEAAINEADKRDRVDPEALRMAADRLSDRPGLAILREVLDRRTFALTDSQLERCLLPISRRAGLSQPLTQQVVNGFKVDFYWPRLGLVVETDGLRYHRTPAQQARDRVRDQVHAAAGLTSLRFTHAQVRYEPAHVAATLSAVAARLAPGDD